MFIRLYYQESLRGIMLAMFIGLPFPFQVIFEAMTIGNITVEDRSTLAVRVDTHLLQSDYLEREVTFDIYTDAHLQTVDGINLLLVNDGQDLPKMPFEQIFKTALQSENIRPLMVVGIYCGPFRDQEYGTICRLDYKGRGTRAGLYTRFIFDELLPFIKGYYNISAFNEKAVAGFSLGGLTALDMAWNYPNEFSKVGVFSGSLWWRRRGINDDYDWEKDRIMHLQIKKGTYKPGLKFFIQTGALDETADRNNNGIIDSIDDALDLIGLLKEKGYKDSDINYVELADGKHDVQTWAKAFPSFLEWAWGRH